MVDFDFFSQPQGPDIKISLFGDARSQGIQAGHNLPTTITSVVRGIQEGVGKGQQTVANQQAIDLNQHTIDQLPTEDALRQQELERRTRENELAKIDQQIILDNKDLYIQAKTDQLKGQLADTQSKKEMYDVLGAPQSVDPSSVMQSSAFQNILRTDPKLAEQVLGRLKPNMTEQQIADAYSMLDFSKGVELQEKKREFDGRVRDKQGTDFDKIHEKIVTGELAGPLTGKTASEIYGGSYEVYPLGQKQEVDGKINRNASDNAIDMSVKSLPFVLYKDGVNTGNKISKSSAEEFNVGKNKYTSLFPNVGQNNTPTAQDVPSSTANKAPTAQPKLFHELVGEFSKTTGLPVDQSDTVLADVRAAGVNSNDMVEAIKSVIPSFIVDLKGTATVAQAYLPQETELGQPIREKDTVALVRKALDKTSVEAADKTMSIIKSGTPEEKQAVRDWAAANSVELNKKSLTEFYRKKTADAAAEVEDNAYQMGIRQKATDYKKLQASEAANSLSKSVYSGTTAEQAAQGARQRAISKAKEVTSSLNLPANVAKTVEVNTKNVSYNPLFEFKPSFVKAIAAVENGGNSEGVSRTGVRGPMQVTQVVAKQYGLNRNIPEQNVIAGQMYLEDLLRQFRGNKELAYAAYNVGPSVVQDAVKRAGSDDWADVRKYIRASIYKYKAAIGDDPEKKFREVFSYPEKVSMYEEIFT